MEVNRNGGIVLWAKLGYMVLDRKVRLMEKN